MIRTLSMVSHKNYNLNVNQGFVIFSTSKLFTCFNGDFTSTMKLQSIVHLLNGNEHIYWILDLEGEVHPIWDLWVNGLQECKSNEFFFEIGRGCINFQLGPKKIDFWNKQLHMLDSNTLKSSWGEL